MQTIYTEFCKKRFNWQDRALLRIKKQLYQYAPFKSLQDEMDERIVITCGLPQSGKTEVILALLGVVQEKRKEIYTILRAEQRIGTSSTASAMCYYAHTSERFCLTGFPTQESKDTDLTAEELKTKLKALRKAVEDDCFHSEIINIGIPSCYFDETEDSVRLKVIDLPGIHSSNSREEAQVRRVVQKYLAIANVVLFVCATNNVAQVEDSEISRTLDHIAPLWRKNKEQFIFVPTGVFSQTKIDKSLEALSTPPEVCRGILKNCEQEIRRHLNEPSEVAVFPLELGKSLRALEDIKFSQTHDQEKLIAQMRLQAECSVMDLRNEIKKKQGKLPLHIVLTWLRQTERLYAKEQLRFELLFQEIEKKLNSLVKKAAMSKNLYEVAQKDLNDFRKKENERKKLWDAFKEFICSNVIQKDESWQELETALQEKLKEKVKKSCNKDVADALYCAAHTFENSYKQLLEDKTKELGLKIAINDLDFDELLCELVVALEQIEYPFGIEKKFWEAVKKEDAIPEIMRLYERFIKVRLVSPVFEQIEKAATESFENGTKNETVLQVKAQERRDMAHKREKDVERAQQELEALKKQRAQATEEAVHATESLKNYEEVIKAVFFPEMQKQKRLLIKEENVVIKQKIALFMLLLQWDYDNLMTMERSE